jgi:hypothetical protein
MEIGHILIWCLPRRCGVPGQCWRGPQGPKDGQPAVGPVGGPRLSPPCHLRLRLLPGGQTTGSQASQNRFTVTQFRNLLPRIKLPLCDRLPYRTYDTDKGGNAALMAPEVAVAVPGTFTNINYSKVKFRFTIRCVIASPYVVVFYR